MVLPMPTLEQARSARDEGMERAAENAGAKWRETAYEFLRGFLAAHSLFISEDVSEASKAAGMAQPPTDRAWGPLYVRAVKAGLMVQDGTGRSRRRHASICPRWKSLVAG